MNIREYLVIFIVTMIIQIYSRFTYVQYKNYVSYSNYTGADIGSFILKNYNKIGTFKPIKNSNNYEVYSYSKKSIYLKKSVYYGKSLTSVAIAAQRTFMYMLSDNMIGNIRMLLAPFVEVAVKLAWVLVALSLSIRDDSIGILGLIILFITFLYNLLYVPLQVVASVKSYQYLCDNVLEKEEHGIVKKVLIHNILFYVTNYSQPLFDLFYYVSRTIIRKLRKKS